MTLNNKNTMILTVIGIFALFAVAMIAGPLAQTTSDNNAFAKSNHGDSDEADQGISEKQSSEQNSQCVSGDDIALSCNNLGAQDQSNEGDSALGQQGGDDDGNSADQSGEQGQSSKQNSQCVAGGSIALSCNNLGAQDQSNEGDSALGQQGGDDDGNSADQSGEQGQSSEQNSQCVSGEEAIVSCNNAQFQDLINSGNRALGQD